MATMSAMMASNVLGGVRSVNSATLRRTNLNANFSSGFVKTSGGRSGGLNLRYEGVKESVDKATKTEISRDEILRNQSKNESERQSVFGAVRKRVSVYPRPEVERRRRCARNHQWPFSNGGPCVGLPREEDERAHHLRAALHSGRGLRPDLLRRRRADHYSVIPILNGESSDARSFGPFRAQAERWNGRLAMSVSLSLLLTELLLTEQFIHAPVFSSWF